MSKRITTMLPYAYFEGEVRPSSEAMISLASHTVQYGTGVFGGMRGYFGGPGKVMLFRVRDHYERMQDAVKILGMKMEESFEQFVAILEELVEKNVPEGGVYFRPIVYSDDEVLTPCFHKLSYKLGVYMIALGDYLDTSRGLRLKVSTFKKFSDASISTKAKAAGAYLHASLARTEANNAGYDEALVMDQNFNVVEGSAANLMIVRRGEVFVPPLSAAMLEGITLRSVLSMLEDEGIVVHRENIDRSMLYTADEVLLLGTGAQVVFAESVDDRKIGDGEAGEICELLRRRYDDLIEMKDPRSKEWMHEVTF